MDEFSIREGLALFSAVSLFAATMIADRRRAPVDALKSATPAEIKQQKALERAKHYLRLVGWRNMAAKGLIGVSALSLIVAIVLYTMKIR